MNIYTLGTVFERWQAEILPEIIRQYGEDDIPAMSESWNDYTDALCKDGGITYLQYHYCPAYDDPMPDNDLEHVLEGMGVKFKAIRIDSRPDGFMPETSRHFSYKIKRAGRRIKGYFSQGMAHTQEPTLSDVFGCLLSDAQGAQDQNFEDWCSDYGYSTDSCSAHRTFKECQRIARKLGAMFHCDELEQFRELVDL